MLYTCTYTKSCECIKFCEMWRFVSGIERGAVKALPFSTFLSFLKEPECHCVSRSRCVHWTNYCSEVLFLTSPLKVPFPGSKEIFLFSLNTIVIPGSPESDARSQKKLDPPLSVSPVNYAQSQDGWSKVSDLSLGCPDACGRQTGWHVPGQAALRHWPGLNCISKPQYTVAS